MHAAKSPTLLGGHPCFSCLTMLFELVKEATDIWRKKETTFAPTVLARSKLCECFKQDSTSTGKPFTHTQTHIYVCTVYIYIYQYSER